MKGYCPNCGRYMAAVRRENKQLLHLICETCEALLLRYKPEKPPDGYKLEPMTPRPAYSKVILEMSEEEVLVVIPAQEWEAASLIAVVAVGLVASITLVGSWFIPDLSRRFEIFLVGCPLLELYTLWGWYESFHRQERLWIHATGIFKEKIHRTQSRVLSTPLDNLRRIAVGKEEKDDNVTHFVALELHSGGVLYFGKQLTQQEVKWLVSALQRAPMFRNKPQTAQETAFAHQHPNPESVH